MSRRYFTSTRGKSTGDFQIKSLGIASEREPRRGRRRPVHNVSKCTKSATLDHHLQLFPSPCPPDIAPGRAEREGPGSPRAVREKAGGARKTGASEAPRPM